MLHRTSARRSPEISGGRGWLNTDKPLSLAALKGKVVLLDFWTYGCINCIHIIPDLKKLEEKYARQLVVIGVHSAKFENEKQTENIRRIILRYEIEHPVYNDAEFKVWESYGVRAWPTQILIDPGGYVIGSVSGEGNYDVIDQAIEKAVADFRKRGELNEEPLKLSLERAKVGDLPLAFPGKLVADAKSDRLFIADSNHNRIVITRLDGTLVKPWKRCEPRTERRLRTKRVSSAAGNGVGRLLLYVADTATIFAVKSILRRDGNYCRPGGNDILREDRREVRSEPWTCSCRGRTLYSRWRVTTNLETRFA